MISGKEIIVNISTSPSKGGQEMKKTITPKLLLDLLEVGPVDLELWGESEMAKLVGAGKKSESDEAYAIAKVWSTELRREVIDLVAITDIRGVKLSV